MARSPIVARYVVLRIVQFVAAEIILVAGLAIVFHRIPGALFWPITTGLALPCLFAEPYFTGPRNALATAAAQVAAYFSSQHGTETALWRTLLIASVIVGASALIAMARQERAGQLFHWLSTRVGRAVVLGSIVSVILVLQVADTSGRRASGLSALLLIVYAVLFLDWSRLAFGPSRLFPDSATITSVFGPNQLLIRSFGSHVVGARVRVKGSAGQSNGYVAEELASGSGSQYRVILDDHWRKVTDGGNDIPCALEPVADTADVPAGFAIEGSTESVLRVSPSTALQIGGTYELKDEVGPLLYQVAGLQLEDEVWSGGGAIVPRARLTQVGAVDAQGLIAARPSLPLPYQPIHTAAQTSANLSSDYMRIGSLKGTNVPVGIRTDWMANHGHLAILGMSGMGKTTIAAKLVNIRSAEAKFVILDETSEYRTRLSFATTALNDIDWNAGDTVVCEPSGELPVRCRDLIKLAMTAAQAEYQAGDTPRRRYVLLEEAHGWLPEWNFATRPNTDAVNESCRFILQARKFNLTFVMISQRTAVISKSALSQCENYIILRTLDQTSLEYVEGVVGSELKKIIPELQKYEAVCVGPIFNSDSPIIVSLDAAIG